MSIKGISTIRPDNTPKRTLMPNDHQSRLAHLMEHGYVVIPEVLNRVQTQTIRDDMDRIFSREREIPFLPEDGDTLVDDSDIESYLRSSYNISKNESDRLMQRIRHTRNHDLMTRWPCSIEAVNKTFLHLPTLFDEDRSQRIWNLLNKSDTIPALAEHTEILKLAQNILGTDCILSDCSATSIGPHTEGGAWHVDVPLGQLPDPLPDFPLTTQNVWMLDDFTESNGATRVVPRSHLLRRKPQWDSEHQPNAISLTGPAGSVAMWLSNTWHCSGANITDFPRRAVLCYYARSWIKPFSDFQRGISLERRACFSETLRYLLGHSSKGLVRG
jgi:ectoine hydroxylase-related dioxygenase (phytanoyl-CoA dioxygenase family)